MSPAVRISDLMHDMQKDMELTFAICRDGEIFLLFCYLE